MTDLDLLSPEHVRDPYPLLARLRTERPVAWSAAHHAWLVTRHADVSECLFDERLSSDRIRPVYETKLTPAQQAERKPTYDVLEDWMVFTDPPRHTRLRGLVRAAFTPRAVARMEPRIVEVVDGLLDSLAEDATSGTEIDLIDRFCYPIPAVVIAEMMGVPRSDVEKFKAWSDCVLTIVFGTARDKERLAAAQDGLIELRDYLADLVARYRRSPAENLISDLAAVVEDDDRLTTGEIVATCVLLLFGGHETTTNLIGNGTLSLMDHPSQVERLLADPGKGVEELLRYDGPSKLEVRRCVSDMELGGATIGEGAQVFLMQLAANRDPDAFDDPDTLDLSRKPGKHVTFGLGVHYCLGAPIARLEGRIALERLFRRFPSPAAGETPPDWHATLVSRGMRSFPVRLSSRRMPERRS